MYIVINDNINPHGVVAGCFLEKALANDLTLLLRKKNKWDLNRSD
jgi:hypothetical protein